MKRLEVLATVETRVARLLDRHGLSDPHDAAGTCDNWQEETPVLASCFACPILDVVSALRKISTKPDLTPHDRHTTK